MPYHFKHSHECNGTPDQDSDVRHKSEIRNITILAFFTNFSVTALKFVVGIIGNSQAVVADAWHSLSDLSTDLLILIGVKFWTAPPDSNHPYGHSRIEAVVTTLMGCVLLTVAIKIGFHAISTIGDEHSLPTWVAMLGPVTTIVVKTWLYKKTISFGEEIKSSAVVANANHQLSDVVSSIPALIGCVVPVFFPELAIIDHLGAVVVGCFILNLAYEIMGPALMELSDIGIREGELLRISGIAQRVPGVQSVENIRSRKMGSGYFLDLTVRVQGSLSVNDAAVIARRVSGLIIKKGPDVRDVIVQIKPAASQARVLPLTGANAGNAAELKGFLKIVTPKVFLEKRGEC